MSISQQAALAAVTVALAGCSIHPLPDDVTGVTTFNKIIGQAMASRKSLS